MNREELVEAVGRIMRADGTEEELEALMSLVEERVPHPEVSDLIFYPEEEMSAEEVVERALSYKPIALP